MKTSFPMERYGSYLPQMFARMQSRTGRQAIMSTHSPSMLQDEGIALDEVLLLSPEEEGTAVVVGKAKKQIRALLEGGLSVAEAVLPYTRPTSAGQLSLFATKP